MVPEERTRKLQEMQALTRSNSALRSLLCLHSLRSGRMFQKETSITGCLEAATNVSDRYERLIGALKLLTADLEMERRRAQLLHSRQCRADIARFLLFMAGGFAIMAIFQSDLPPA